MYENTSIASQPQSNAAALATEATPVHEQQDVEKQLVDRLPVQRKLTVGAPNDPLEYEADAMADRVMRMPEAPFARQSTTTDPDRSLHLKPLASEITPFVQRCTTCSGSYSYDDEHVQLKATASPAWVDDYDDEHVQLKSVDNRHTSFIQRSASPAWTDDYDDEHVQLKPSDTTTGEYDDEHIRLKPADDQHTPFIQRSASSAWVDDYDDEHVQLKSEENSTPFIQKCAACGDYDDDHVQLKPASSPLIQTKSDNSGQAGDSVSNRITSSMGGGKPMDASTQSFMESRFGADFSSVKIHNDEQAADLSKSLNAKAFAIKDNIYFNSGNYQPETESGKYLLAHELTHVVQQNGAAQLKQENLSDIADQNNPATEAIQLKVNDQFNSAPSATNTQGVTPGNGTNPSVNQSATPTIANQPSAAASTGSSQSIVKPADTAPVTAKPTGTVPVAATTGASKAPANNVVAKADEPEMPAISATDNPGDTLTILQKTPATQIGKVFQEAKGVATQSEQLQRDEAVKLIPAVPESKGSPYGAKGASKKKFTAKKESAVAKNVFSGKGEFKPPVTADVAIPATPAYVPSNLANLFLDNPSSEAVASTAENELDSVHLDDSNIPDKLDDAPNVPLTGEADVNNVHAEQQAQTDEVAEKKAISAMEISNDFGENDVMPKPSDNIIKSKKPIGSIKPKSSAINPGASVQDELLRGKINAYAAEQINTKIGAQTEKYNQDEVLYRNKITTEKAKTDEQVNTETKKSNALQNQAQVDAQTQVNASRIEWQKKLDDSELTFQTKAGEAAQTHVEKIDDAAKDGNAKAKQHYDDANEEVAKKKTEAKQEAETKKQEAKSESKGFWGWLANKASALIDGLKKAVNFIFDKLRAAVKWAFDKAKKLAMAAIELARNVVVGLIKAFGEALKLLVDVVFAAFPEIRDEINGKIDNTVNKAVSLANQAFDTFKEVVAAIIDTYAAIVDTALAIVQKSLNIALSVVEVVVVASLKIIGFLLDIEKQYKAFKQMIDELTYLWDNPQVVENKAKEFIGPYVEEIPEKTTGAIKDALVQMGLDRHLTGIMKYLVPALMSIKTGWWGMIKDMLWYMIWPFAEGSPLWTDAPKLWHLIPQMWADFKNGEYSKVTDGGLEWMQALNNTVGAFALWLPIGGAIIGAILGGIFGAGAGALPGAGAGFEAGIAAGEGLMASMIATETLVIAKAVYDLSVTTDDGIESPVPPPAPQPEEAQKEIKANTDVTTAAETTGQPSAPVEPEAEKAPRTYTSGQVKTGRDRILYAYQRIANSGLTLGIMLAFLLLGSVGGKIANWLVSKVKAIGQFIGEVASKIAPEATEGLKNLGKGIGKGVKNIAKGLRESKPVKAIEGAFNGLKESNAGKKIAAGMEDFNKGRAAMKKQIAGWKKKIGLGKPKKGTPKPGETAADTTAAETNKPKERVTDNVDTETTNAKENVTEREKPVDDVNEQPKQEVPEGKKVPNSPVEEAPLETVPDADADVQELPEGSVMIGEPGSEIDTARMYRNSIKDSPGREVAIYHNPETGEFIVIQGDEGTVFVDGPGGTKEGPAAGRAQQWKELLNGEDIGNWDLVSHYHPVEDGGFVSAANRMPSGATGDFGVIMDESASAGNKPRTSKIDYKTPRGNEFTLFTYDPADAKPFKIDYPDPVTLKREHLEFSTLQEYHDWMLDNHGVDMGPVTDTAGIPAAAKGKGKAKEKPVSEESTKEYKTAADEEKNKLKKNEAPVAADAVASAVDTAKPGEINGAKPAEQASPVTDETPPKRPPNKRMAAILEKAKGKLKDVLELQEQNEKKIEELIKQRNDAASDVRNLAWEKLKSQAGSKERAAIQERLDIAREKLQEIIDEDELGGYFKDRTKYKQAEQDILASLELKRPSLSEWMKEQIRKKAKRTEDGKFFIDANTGETITGAIDYGHIYGKENRRLILEASEAGMTQEEFNNWVNSLPDWFQIETPANNRSHKYEKPGID